MAVENASRDQNDVPTLLAVSSSDGISPVKVYADPTTHRLKVDLSGGGGTGTWYDVSGTINSVNVTFTIPVTPSSDFILVLVNQTQMLGIDYTVVADTITMTVAPDISLSGLGFK